TLSQRNPTHPGQPSHDRRPVRNIGELKVGACSTTARGAARSEINFEMATPLGSNSRYSVAPLTTRRMSKPPDSVSVASAPAASQRALPPALIARASNRATRGADATYHQKRTLMLSHIQGASLMRFGMIKQRRNGER